MALETLVLGAVSGVRPATSQAAVFALLKAPDPRRSLLVFTLAGFAVSVAVGLLMVAAFDGAAPTIGRSRFSEVFELVAGVAALAFAFGYRQGRIAPRTRREGDAGAGTPSRLTRHLTHPTPAAAAAAGVATHLPGLIYLVALNAIAAERPRPLEALVQVATYNVLWFAVPLAALAVAIFRPERARSWMDRATGWGQRHQEVLVVALFTALGAYLAVKGATGLLG
jgi:hypothetical protein